MEAKIFFAVLLYTALNSSPVFSQKVEEKTVKAKSNLENFSEASGSFSRKDIINLAEISGVSIKIIRIHNITTDKVVSGIKFSGYTGSTYRLLKSAFLDKDEVEAFLNVVNYTIEKVFDSPYPENDTEYNFYSRSGFGGGAYSSAKGWRGYLTLDKYSDSDFFFKKDDFIKIAKVLEDNKRRLE